MAFFLVLAQNFLKQVFVYVMLKDYHKQQNTSLKSLKCILIKYKLLVGLKNVQI